MTMAVAVAGEVWVGIDPGKKGYVVALKPNGVLESWPVPLKGGEEDDGDYGDYDLPGVISIVAQFARWDVAGVMLERQQPAYRAPGQEKVYNNLVRASFMIGYGFALWETALTAFNIPYDLVMPGVWKKQMGLTAPKEVTERSERAKATKGNSVALASSLWPKHDFKRTPRCKPSPDQCEAALLAEYGRRKHGG
jgi:hypothetical protein